MEKITFEELRNYIISQDDERAVNMAHNHYRNSCGCVMMHYAFDFLDVANPCAGYASIFDENENEVAQLSFNMNDLIHNAFTSEARTYGELKNELRKSPQHDALGDASADFL
jgi:hypothetical protein